MRNIGDLNWVLAPLCSFLYTLGGWSWRTLTRRIFLPLSISLFAFFYYKLKRWWYAIIYILSFFTCFGVLTLPLTLIGDSVHSHWFNWAWIFILGGVMGTSLIPLAILSKRWKRTFIGIGIMTFATGIPLLLSNLTNIMPHKIVEIIIGLFYGGVAGWIIEPKD